MLTNILIVIGIVIAAVLIVAALKPATFRVSRSSRMQAPADRIFAYLNDFRQWAAWSPWEKLDPSMRKNYAGVAGTPGASYSWDGNNKAGTGSMTVTSVTTPSKLVIDLRFEKPWQAKNVATFTLEPAGDATQVLWTMEGASPYMFRLMGLFMSMDKLVGKDFEAGLASIKSLVER